MRTFFFKLFSDTPTGSWAVIESFNLWHFLYLIIIISGIIGCAFLCKNKSADVKDKILRVLAIALIVSYLADFLFHDFVYSDDGVTGDGLNMDKLPFHICTVMCPVILFTQFNKRCHKFIEPVAALAIVAPLMYLTYPSSGVGGEPWCYRTMQTMFFHGVELAWGFLAVAFGKTKFAWKNVWKAGVLLCGITLWAKFGNLMLDYNWFFIESDPFGVGLAPYLLIFVIPASIFAMVALIYSIYFGVLAVMKKAQNKRESTVSEEETKEENEVVLEVAVTENEERTNDE